MSTPLKRAVLLLALSLGATQAHAGGDLVYTHRLAEVEPLKAYEGQPYWRVLAECAGIHGALANRYQSQGRERDFQAAKMRGVSFLQTANRQLRADRGLPAAEAQMLTAEAVDVGRDTGAAFLARKPASGLSHEQLVDLLCSQVAERHARATRGR